MGAFVRVIKISKVKMEYIKWINFVVPNLSSNFPRLPKSAHYVFLIVCMKIEYHRNNKVPNISFYLKHLSA